MGVNLMAKHFVMQHFNKLQTTIKCFKFCCMKEQMNCNVILLHHKNVYSNPQYNPTSLRIKEMQNYYPQVMGTFRPNKSCKIKEKVYHCLGQYHDIALVQNKTLNLYFHFI